MRDLYQIRVFVAVVEKGSFSAAAFHLNQSASGVSKYIARLEQELGLQLFDRSAHKFTVTPAGTEFFETAQKMLSDIETIIDDLHGVRDDFRGKLHVHVTPGAGVIALPILADFLSQHRDVNMTITVIPNAVDVLNDGFDLSIRTGAGKSDAYFRHSSVASLKICDSEFHYYASPKYLRREGRPQNPDDLAAHRCLVYSVQPSSDQWAFGSDRKKHFLEIKPYLISNDFLVIYDAMISGVGIARLSSATTAAARRDQLVVDLFPDESFENVGLWAFYPRMRPLPKKLESLLDSLKNSLRDV